MFKKATCIFRSLTCLSLLVLGNHLLATNPPGEGPNLDDNLITQAEIESGSLNLRNIRKKGQLVFSTPFNKLDGFGDGPINPADTTTPGGRPTLQNNGTLLRVNGLDGQTCLECHAVLSNAEVPFKFGVGGVGGAATNAIALPSLIDVADDAGVGFASFNGRYINPPFLFGSGGVELLGKEMTRDLQALKQFAISHPGTTVDLETKGVNFGTIVYSGGSLDTSDVQGIEHDLVVRPFGRKGEFISTRDFDISAMQFHFGIQPTEMVGEGVDADGDGVVNELSVGELSALAIFNTTLERPIQEHRNSREQRGFEMFQEMGCADCHMPVLTTESRDLNHAFPEIPDDPDANVYYTVRLTREPTDFDAIPGGGIEVPLFADLKRHDMGPGLAESTGGALDSFFTTARLWGVADTAPYLHDGRALTLTDAILLHGGEAQDARDEFAGLSDSNKEKVLEFLRTLRTPRRVGGDLN